MSFRVIENENKKRSPLSLCVKCDRWIYFYVASGGWWKPICADWNQNKSTKEEPYGPKSSCPYNFEHVILTKRGKFKLDTLTDCEPIVEMFKKEKVKFVSGSYEEKYKKTPALKVLLIKVF